MNRVGGWIPVFAVCGFVFAVFAAVRGAKAPEPAVPVCEPGRPPFEVFVSGAGLVEASSENVEVGADVGGIVARVFVGVGSRVMAGDPLFEVDGRAQRAAVAVRRAAWEVAEAQLADLRNSMARGERLASRGVLSMEDRDLRRFAVWRAEAARSLAMAELEAARVEEGRLVVRALMAGDVLQVRVHPGEYARAGGESTPLMVLGATEPMHVRVDVDENEAWRVRAGARARGYVRGNKNIEVGLEMVRVEPFVVPKTSLTGAGTERVDTRVLQLVFRFRREGKPIYIGQQMDVYIEANGQMNPTRTGGLPRDGPISGERGRAPSSLGE